MRQLSATPSTREHGDHAFPSDENEPDSVTGWAGTAEQHICPNCSVVGSDGEGFCTSCGTPLSISPAPALVQEAHPRAAGEPDLLRSSRKFGGSRRMWIVTAVSLLVLGLSTALVLFATAWHQQTAKKHAAEASLTATRTQLATTQGRLRQSQALLARQQTILKQTATVLRKVDPLLSGADQLQQITTEIQSARDTFASDSATMTSDLIYLENAVADPASYQGVDTWSLAGQVNAELDTVRSDFATLALYDGNYSDASTAFGNTADTLTKAVRQLQTELKAVSTP
jgi:hypothetical protein